MGVSKIRGPNIDPNGTELLSEGHPRNGSPIYTSSHILTEGRYVKPESGLIELRRSVRPGRGGWLLSL